MNVTWSDPRPLLNGNKSAVDAFVSFLLFADGGVAALWADGSDVRVATCDSEGQYAVLAQDFRDFLALLARPGAFRLAQVAAERWDVTYVDYRVWREVPAKYGFAAVLPELLGAMKTRKKSYALSINRDGHVFADRGNQIALEP